jgi:hypothetical protein
MYIHTHVASEFNLKSGNFPLCNYIGIHRPRMPVTTSHDSVIRDVMQNDIRYCLSPILTTRMYMHVHVQHNYSTYSTCTLWLKSPCMANQRYILGSMVSESRILHERTHTCSMWMYIHPHIG